MILLSWILAKKIYKLKAGKYDPTFIKAIAMAIHLEILEPAELEFWQEGRRSQEDMSRELYTRIKSARQQPDE